MTLKFITDNIYINPEMVIGVSIDSESELVVVECQSETKFYFAPEDFVDLPSDKPLTLPDVVVMVVNALKNH